MNIKPMFEPDGFKPEDKKRPVPTHNRQHPKDSSLVHRTGRAIVNDKKGKTFTRPEDGASVYYGRKGEGELVKALRHSTRSSRSKLAEATSSAKTQIFVRTQIDTDYRLDAPTITPQVNPGPVRARRHVEHRRRLQRSA